MGLLRRLRHRAGALIYDWPAFERRIRAEPRAGEAEPWLQIRNRREKISTDARGVRCHWRFTSQLHIANVFPATGARLMRRALGRWPVALRDAPLEAGRPDVSFVVGHRGLDRLPLLLQTLRSIAGQSEVAIECIVVEQSGRKEIEGLLPSWVKYIYTPILEDALPYCRSWAFNVGARVASSDVLILHDNDMIVSGRYAAQALERIREGWLFADLKRFIFYLPAVETERLLGTGRLPVDAPVTVVQNAQGGSIVAKKDAFFAIGGFDEAFTGWGGEDNDFWDRAQTMERVYAFGYLPFVHLHHPPQSGKAAGATDAVHRYRQIETIDPRQRVARLLEREQGRTDRPAAQP